MTITAAEIIAIKHAVTLGANTPNRLADAMHVSNRTAYRYLTIATAAGFLVRVMNPNGAKWKTHYEPTTHPAQSQRRA